MRGNGEEGGRKVKKCEKYCVNVGCRVPIIEERRKMCTFVCGGGGEREGGHVKEAYM